MSFYDRRKEPCTVQHERKYEAYLLEQRRKSESMKRKEEVLQEDDLQKVMKKHHDAVGEWKEGRAVSAFYQDGYPCVKYESGNWWHYNTNAGTWF